MRQRNVSHVFVFLFLLLFLSATADARIGKPRTSLNLREEPRQSSRVLVVLQPEDTVDVLLRTRGWYHVRVQASGKTGYVARKFLKVTSRTSEARPTQTPVRQSAAATPMPTPPVVAHHSTIRVNRAVLSVIEDFHEKLSALAIPYSTFGDEYPPPPRLVVIFGPGVSLPDLRAAIDATGPDPDLYMLPVSDDASRDTIIVGAEGGGGQKLAKLPDIYNALQAATELEDFAAFVYQKAKSQP